MNARKNRKLESLYDKSTRLSIILRGDEGSISEGVFKQRAMMFWILRHWFCLNCRANSHKRMKTLRNAKVIASRHNKREMVPP